MLLKKYIEEKLLKRNIDLVRKYSKSLNKLCGVEMIDLTMLSYQDVKHNIPNLINSDKYEEAIAIIIKRPLWRIKLTSPRKRLLFIFWVEEQYKLIEQLEATNLHSEPSMELVSAGIDRLNVLGDINLIDTIADGDPLKWRELRKLSYNDIFLKQMRDNILNDVYLKLEKIRIEKAKNKR